MKASSNTQHADLASTGNIPKFPSSQNHVLFLAWQSNFAESPYYDNSRYDLYGWLHTEEYKRARGRMASQPNRDGTFCTIVKNADNADAYRTLLQAAVWESHYKSRGVNWSPWDNDENPACYYFNFKGIILLPLISPLLGPNLCQSTPGQDIGVSHTASQSYHTVTAIISSLAAWSSSSPSPFPPYFRASLIHSSRQDCTVRATSVRGVFSGDNLYVFCKIIDLFESLQGRDFFDVLDTEVRNYATLLNLQG